MRRTRSKILGGNMTVNKEVFIRPMNENDYSLMTKWLNDERVIEYYGPKLSLEQVIEKYSPRIEGKHNVKPYIVEYQNTPVGYMQYYQVPKDQLKSYGYLKSEAIFGIDQFIGESLLWDKGIGTTMIGMILNFINVMENINKVVLDVKSTNVRAIKCYEKCGFHQVRILEDNHLLMEWKSV